MVGKGKGESFLAQSAPRMTWSELKEVLAQVVAGLVRVDLEYVPEDISGGGAAEAEGEKAAVRVASEGAWQRLLEYLRAKSQAGPQGEQTEAEVDLVLLKTAGGPGANISTKD